MTTVTLEPVRAWAAERSDQVDRGELAASEAVALLAADGLLDLGVDDTAAAVAAGGPTAAVSLRSMGDVIAAVAEECLSSAFSVWAHRMAIEYLARGRRSALSEDAFAELRSGRLVGCSAMAAAMKQASGLGDLGVTGRREGDEIVLDGSIAWASNLVPGAVVVTAVDLAGEPPVVTWFTVGSAGVQVQPARGLLALESTASGRVVLQDVRTPVAAVLSEDLPSFTAGFRPTLLLLQSAFCVGLTRRCVADALAGLGRPETRALDGEVHELAARADEVERRWQRAVADPAPVTRHELLRLRLDASHVCQDATRLAATLAGGRGYVATSTASRRLREAAFLPVQSPSEGHLRWELSSSS
ncbi:acyl-CoA dehydrogenase family protein [Arsenicicoccus sp. oral taxon 190]|uniref:acyl-CoA dehydrogenase family protein n=1 Tax=Arsenicicoccus sp. oral taxon 190 TaxID=1658671 RepID=UPI00067A1B8F|nr:acyl-CoA dehydrogenase family protein [Arsenicicoccus sp. oral taxon 190]AKT51559.1 hypothetical protein ADJ73_10070 [Arsenicicoccus sp. oral taxon 190]